LFHQFDFSVYDKGVLVFGIGRDKLDSFTYIVNELFTLHVFFGINAQDINHEQIELQAKLLNYFLGSNKSNIN